MSKFILVESQLTECPMCGRTCVLAGNGPDGSAQCMNCGAYETLEPIVRYLTDARGKRSGHGDIESTDEDFAKVAFEAGPGVIRTRLAQVGDQLFVLGILAIPFYDPFHWEGCCEDDELGCEGCESDARQLVDAHQVMEDSARAIAQIVRRRLAARLPDTFVIVEDEGTGSNVVAAIPLASVSDSGDTWDMLAAAFGDRARASVDGRKRLEQHQFRRRFNIEAGHNASAPNACTTMVTKNATSCCSAWFSRVRQFSSKWRIVWPKDLRGAPGMGTHLRE